jgi:hypothetical protein
VEPVPSTAPDLASVATALEHATTVLETLTGLGEDVEDEWQYVQDLSAAWLARFDEVATARGPDALSPAVADAIGRLSGEASRVTDPHRAIDWLSTFPQAVLVALGERA